MERAREDLQQLSANERGGVVQGYTPIYSHVQLYLVQIISIVVLCFVLGQLVKKWNQPRVIAEVMAGVLLGPSALGAIPGFTATLFPEYSLEALTLTSHLGLILFLFIVGLELDPGLLQSNAKKASILSIVGQSVTWVLSLGVSRAMITWMDDVESSTSFVLFIGVSLSVTAFPVLSRILGENSLLNTNVGALVISAASVDEACVWCLLALVVSTVNAGSPLDAFYVFLLLAFFVITMLTVVRWALLRIVRIVSAEDTGAPSRGVVILCLLLTLVSAWVTDFIGIDAIFGAFVAGIIVPREHSLHVRIVELVQDIVSVLLLPLYFAVSGLKTDLTLLDNATSWGICLLTISAACLGKIGGGAAVARVFGMTGRESLAVGVLMNTRGLVELIILNIGLDAGVLTEEVMAIMVVMALVTTFMTAPLSGLVYPLKYHSLPGRRICRRTSADMSVSKGDLSRPLATIDDIGEFAQERLRLLVLLSNTAGLDAVTRIAKIFSGNRTARKSGPLRRKLSGIAESGGELVVHALRLVENTDRFSSDMRALDRGGETMNKDSLAGILQGFLGLLMIKVKSHVSVGTPTDFCQDVTRITDEHAISTVVFPWEHGSTNPSSQLARAEKMMRATPCQFVIAMNSHSDGLAMATSQGVSVLVPFFGGDDDIAALLLALAIIERDSTTELVILSFLEPEKPISGGGGGGGGVNDSESMRRADGGHRKQDSESLMTMFTSPCPAQRAGSELENANEDEAKDIEAPPEQTNASCTNAPTTLPETARVSNPAPKLPSQSTRRGRRAMSSWSSRDLIKKAEGLARVTVTPAWSLNAALDAMSTSSAGNLNSTSATAAIVQQVATAQATGLILCGCAGSGQMTASAAMSAPGYRGNSGSAGQAPLSGTGSFHARWPSLGPLSRSRHGGSATRSLTTRSWHGKSRLHGRSSHHATVADSRGERGTGHPALGYLGRPTSNTRGGLASAVDSVLVNALEDLVGDIVVGLMTSGATPAVFAVRASVPPMAKSAMVA